ncbi:Glycerol operon regulatory protein [Pandoraea eparura]|jgi:DNA-binding IclR family transcriptional regulator|uniref:Glycerol operon regulatory protein n=1 Tax=Pandoraea eparura TaxID=2508291 RepID=A0A5E4SY80_9BURK|nr:IclR family transcriptional regulator C-terminal domain-containing protein [Pandoraea eparura]VVD80525.1 Glycerol operon regulatory protein [Pandoraea eparura]
MNATRRTAQSHEVTDDAADDVASTPAKPQRGIQALESTGALLEALAAAGRPLPLNALARDAGMAPAKAHPHLVSLQRAGLISRDANGNFEAGALSLELGLMALQRLSPTGEAEPEILALAQATGLSAAMAVLGPVGPTVVRLEEAMRPQHVSLRIGTVLSLVNTAIGRTFAAFLPEAVLDGMLAQEPVRMAGLGAEGRAPTPPADYAARLKAIREQRVDTAQSNPVPGIDTVAVPVFDHTGEVTLVLALMGSAGSFETALDAAPAQALLAAARRLSWRFGAVGRAYGAVGAVGALR